MFENLEKLRKSEVSLVAVKKEALLRVALFYPNTYAVASSNLGFHSLYRLFNDNPRILCERFTLPDIKRGSAVSSYPFLSIDRRTPLQSFDVIAFTVSYEPDIVHLIDVLLQSGIPPLSSDRGERDPLVIGGGAVMAINPEPAAPFLDVVCIGEGEVLVPALAGKLLDSPGRGVSREDILSSMEGAEGLYVPGAGIPSLRSIRRVHAESLDSSVTASAYITPLTTFRSMFLVELNRGCPFRCRFCVTPPIYGPLRFRSAANVLALASDAGSSTRRIGLVGAAVASHPGLRGLCGDLLEKGWEINISSLRAELCDGELLGLLHRGGLSTLTIAPEAGSERLRSRLCKGVTGEQFIETAFAAGKMGFSRLRLYFLIGLPGETEQDLRETLSLVRALRDSYRRGSRGKGTVSVTLNPFIPKPFTPLQWAPVADSRHLREARALIRSGLRKQRDITVSTTGTREAHLQALLSRGDRDAGLAVYRDRIRVMEKGGPAAYDLRGGEGTWHGSREDRSRSLFRERKADEDFPWDSIDHGVDKAALRREYEKLMTDTK